MKYLWASFLDQLYTKYSQKHCIDCSCVLWKTILLKFSLAWEIPSEVLKTSQRAFCRATLLNGFPHGRDLNLVLGFSSNLHHNDKQID